MSFQAVIIREYEVVHIDTKRAVELESIRKVEVEYMRGFLQEEERQCCGTCKYHTHEDFSDGWVCTNAGSIYCTEWTDYNDSCELWEEKRT